MNGAVPQVEVDQVLVRQAEFTAQILEVGYGAPVQANGDWLLQPGNVRVLLALHFGEVIGCSHGISSRSSPSLV